MKSAREIALAIRDEMVTAARADGVTFDDDQLGFIEQGLEDAAQEAFNEDMNALLETDVRYSRGSDK